MTDRTQPEALRLADALEYCDASVARQAINELRRQHARVAELEAQLEAIGAGGVSGPLMGQPQEMPDLSALTERGAKAWAGVDAQGLREGFTAADMATAEARGFRDGVASVAASAGNEPVAVAEVSCTHVHGWGTRWIVDADRKLNIPPLGTKLYARPPAPKQGQKDSSRLRKALIRAQQAINSMKVEAETAAQGDKRMMLEACETISNEGLQADMAIRDVLANHPSPPEGMVGGWMPIETAPKSSTDGRNVDGIYLLGFCPEPDACNLQSYICIVWWEPNMKGGKGMWYGEGGYEVHPTHWMPLPPPPTSSADSRKGE